MSRPLVAISCQMGCSLRLNKGEFTGGIIDEFDSNLRIGTGEVDTGVSVGEGDILGVKLMSDFEGGREEEQASSECEDLKSHD